jgi:hypothetical protein
MKLDIESLMEHPRDNIVIISYVIFAHMHSDIEVLPNLYHLASILVNNYVVVVH